mgnify:CR=1 FL=1
MSTTSNPSVKVVPQREVTYASNQGLQIGPTNVTLTVPSSDRHGTVMISNGPFGANNTVVDGVSTLRSDQLEHEAFEVPVEELIDLWLVRFGNDWTDLEKIDEDPFWTMAYRRLKALGELEIHYLTDRARYVCRKPK